MYTRRLALFVLLTMLLSLVGIQRPVSARPQVAAVPAGCEDGTLPHGALYLICMPPAGQWNGDVVLWAHGYVAPGEPLQFANIDLPDGTPLPALINGLGYAFATTSYRSNGLAVLDALDDMRELLQAYRQLKAPAPGSRTYLTGASEGGLVAALLAEQSPELFSGALAACGPVGSFQRQITYWGDFRALFDYFFPGVLPGSPLSIPPGTMESWASVYAPAVAAAMQASPSKARQLIAAAKAPVASDDTASAIETALSILWYNVFATNDGVTRLGGNPYDNRGRWYWGSDNDLRLNLRIKRYRADAAALAGLKKYETSGRPQIPIVLPHTTGDPVIRVDQTLLYWLKTLTGPSSGATPLPIARYGHCSFTQNELLLSFGLLLLQTGATSQVAASLTAGFDPSAAQAELQARVATFQSAEAQDAAFQNQFSPGAVYVPLVTR